MASAATRMTTTTTATLRKPNVPKAPNLEPERTVISFAGLELFGGIDEEIPEDVLEVAAKRSNGGRALPFKAWFATAKHGSFLFVPDELWLNRPGRKDDAPLQSVRSAYVKMKLRGQFLGWKKQGDDPKRERLRLYVVERKDGFRSDRRPGHSMHIEVVPEAG